MGWLANLLRSARGEALLKEIDQVVEQALDEIGVFCDCVRTMRAERDGHTSLLVVIHSDAVKTEEVQSLRSSLAFAVNRRLGTRIGKERLIVMCAEPDTLALWRESAQQQWAGENQSGMQGLSTQA